MWKFVLKGWGKSLSIQMNLEVGSLVAWLCKFFQGRNHCIFTDCFHPYVNADDSGKYHWPTGTIPMEIIKKKMDRGSCSLLHNGKTAAVAYCDRKPISDDQFTKLQWCKRHYKWNKVTFLVSCAYNSCVILNYYNPHNHSVKWYQNFY